MSEVIVILNDLGGSVVQYLWESRDAVVEIMGVCASACTLFLSAPDVCVGPQAELWFHAPVSANPNMQLWAYNVVMQRYPDWVVAWLESVGGLTDELVQMPTEYAIRNTKPC